MSKPLALIALTLLLYGCAFTRLQGELAEFTSLSSVNGQIDHDGAASLTAAHGSRESARCAVRPATSDIAPRVIEGLTFPLSEDAVVPGELRHISLASGERRPRFAGGGLADLNAANFGDSYGRMGLWRPMTFLREAGAGVYLLDPYDSAKVPVLFVHGAGGTPRDWRYFVEHLDRSRFQPWVYYYPSGLPLDVSAFWLNSLVAGLHDCLGFEHLIVTAHSMGGLVARRFITLNAIEHGNDYVNVLVTLATPWDGVASAKLGVTLAPCAIPSWIDIAPDSPFLRSLHAASLPSSVRHHLFFGYLSGRNSGDADSDGIVTVASQLERDAQVQATRVYGFRENHTRILTNPLVFARYASVLADEWVVAGVASREQAAQVSATAAAR